MRNVPISLLASARRKPRALTSAEMVAPGCIMAARECFLLAALHSVAERFSHRPAPAPPPSPHGSPLASQRGMYPFTSAGGRRRVARLDGVARAARIEPCALPHARGTCLACYRAGTELLAVEAEACVAVFGRAHGERRASGVRRAAPLWWFRPHERVSAHSKER